MAFFTDEELVAATEAVLNSVLEPLDLKPMTLFVIKDSMENYVRRQVANALTAAARTRGVK
jgi:hypothetical protein